MYPPNYGSIAGKSYLDAVELHDDRFTCNAAGNKRSTGAVADYLTVRRKGRSPPRASRGPPNSIPQLGQKCGFASNTGDLIQLCRPRPRTRLVRHCATGLYWYPQWMGAMPHHPYPSMSDDVGTPESIQNTEIRRKTKVTDIAGKIRKWQSAGHIARRTDNRTGRKVLEWRPRTGRRSVGRVAGNQWMQVASCRSLWRSKGEAFAHQWTSSG
ncbi:hypothetical protein MSG28_013729 [Choristoneura fumiferana]|uniref:Uncharacterized protein n=1 Tax=Choristoneura fumiferana TaxID=7141 RepID=A0ACC0K9E8_CHOFU|nr:hypothetical protein MSG28_013729 [Choristoneura fumiferana]